MDVAFYTQLDACKHGGHVYILSDKIPRRVRFVSLFLSVPLSCLGTRIQGSRAGVTVKLSATILLSLLYEELFHFDAGNGIIIDVVQSIISCMN